MATGVEEITQAALTLSKRERAAVASALPASLEAPADEPAEVQQAWTTEISDRVDDILSGKVKSIPHEEVLAGLAERRAARLAARPQA